jgi:hypothetical protein
MEFGKNKRGSHIGVILSFVIFVAFVIFAYTFLKTPLSSGQGKDTVLNYLEVRLKDKISADLTVATLNVDDANDPSRDCIIFEDFLTKAKMQPARIVTKDASGNTQSSSISGTGLAVERDNTNVDFFKIYNSSEFDLLGGASPACNSGGISQYDIGQIKTQKYIFLSKISEVLAEYETDYVNLKDELDLSGSDDFGFVFTPRSGEEISAERNAPSSVDIYSKDVSVFYVDENADIMEGNLNIRVW